MTTSTTPAPPAASHPAAAMAAQWRPIPKAPGYAVGLAVLLFVVALMPLLYLAAIAAIGWGVWWHLTENVGRITGVASSASARGGLFMLVVALLPAVVGVGLILFLLKPLLAPRSRRDEPFVLHPFEEHKLFNFVETVCAVIGAPPPKEIAIDCDVNAAAGFRGGLLSLFKRGDLVLVIGMPLVAGMTRRQFAGVLAHEFGHFAQGSGMRATYVARSMTNWFARAAYQRDGWDDAVASLAASNEFAFSLLGWLLTLCVGVARLVLRAVVWTCAALASFMLRQMEYDADRYEARFAGSTTFVSVVQRLTELAAAHPKADQRAADMYKRDRKVPDNFPVLVADAADRITPEARADLARKQAARESGRGGGLFATHPSSAARAKRAEALAEPGVYTDESPARGLFADFNAACRKATYAHYKSRLGNFLDDVTFVPTAPLLAPGSVSRSGSGPGSSAPGAPSARDLVPAYLGFQPPTWRPLFLDMQKIPAVEDPRRVIESIKRARAAVHKLAAATPSSSAHADAYRAATEEAARWEHARFLMDTSLKVDFKKLAIDRATRTGVSQRLDDLKEKAAASADALADATDAARLRLESALALLGAKGVDRLVPAADAKRDRANQLLPILAGLKDTQRSAADVREHCGRLEAMQYAVTNQATLDKAKVALRPLSDTVRDRLADARERAGGIPYPFTETDADHTNLGARLVGATPGWRQYDQIFEAGERFVDRWPEEYARALTELVRIADSVERALLKTAKANEAKPAAPGATGGSPARA